MVILFVGFVCGSFGGIGLRVILFVGLVCCSFGGISLLQLFHLLVLLAVHLVVLNL